MTNIKEIYCIKCEIYEPITFKIMQEKILKEFGFFIDYDKAVAFTHRLNKKYEVDKVIRYSVETIFNEPSPGIFYKLEQSKTKIEK